MITIHPLQAIRCAQLQPFQKIGQRGFKETISRLLDLGDFGVNQDYFGKQLKINNMCSARFVGEMASERPDIAKAYARDSGVPIESLIETIAETAQYSPQEKRRLEENSGLVQKIAEWHAAALSLASKKLFNITRCLPDALLVFNQRDADIIITIFTKANAGSNGNACFRH